MRIRRKFLQLTSQTVPYGTEHNLLKYLPKGVKKDEHGNYFITIGDNFTTMFTSHLDTACRYFKNVKHVQTETTIKTDGKTILGADDKAGMTVMLYMISKKVPGLYYFFIGEEVGCIGSSKLSTTFNWPDITKVISFDRRGTSSIITEQMFGRCCSEEFALALADSLNSTGLGLDMEPDDTGIITDSAQFVDIVPECTNISVGYYNEHTTSEVQDIEFLTRLCRACVKVDWESLPIYRIPGEDDYDYLRDDEDEDDDDIKGFIMNDNDYTSSLFTTVIDDGVHKKMYISKTWIEKESALIKSMLFTKGYFPVSIIWDGNVCYCQETDGPYELIGNRDDLMLLIPELQSIPANHLKEYLRSLTTT